MTSKAELRRQWLNLANGAIRTIITGSTAGLSTFVANGVFNMGLGWGAIGWITLLTVAAHLIGWVAKQPIPDVFATETVTTDTATLTVTHTEEPKGD